MSIRIPAALVLALCLAAPTLAADPQTDEQKTVYSIGVALAQSLQPYYLSPAEVALVQQGLTDGLADKPKVDLKEYRVKLQHVGGRGREEGRPGLPRQDGEGEGRAEDRERTDLL